MDDVLKKMMEVCGFKIAPETGLYKHWDQYLAEVCAVAIKGAGRNRHKRDMITLGVHLLFGEFLAGRLPDTLDEATDGAAYMSRAAIEFRDRFIAATAAEEAGKK